MTNVLIIHGLGMERRGIEQIEVFGTMKIDDYNAAITKFADELEVSIEIFHYEWEIKSVAKVSHVFEWTFLFHARTNLVRWQSKVAI